MNHSQNTAEVVNTTYGGEGATLVTYVYDEVHRFVTVARLSFSKRELEGMVNQVDLRRRELDYQTEPLW